MVHLAAVPSVQADAQPDESSVAHSLEKLKLDYLAQDDSFTTTVYGSKYAALDLPKYEMPENEMPKEVAYRMIKSVHHSTHGKIPSNAHQGQTQGRFEPGWQSHSQVSQSLYSASKKLTSYIA